MSQWEVVDRSWAPPVEEETSGPRGSGKCVVLVKRPVAEITEDCFQIVERLVPYTVAEGDVLVQMLQFSMDPTHSIWMRDVVQYSPRVALGNVMRCSGEWKS
jgi:NADPH-dependent curcumin reductase CurA